MKTLCQVTKKNSYKPWIEISILRVDTTHFPFAFCIIITLLFYKLLFFFFLIISQQLLTTRNNVMLSDACNSAF